MATHSMTVRHPLTSTGFTLIELLVVLVIISMIAAVASPRFANALARHRSDVAVTRLLNDFEHARSLASRTSASVSVSIDVPKDILTIVTSSHSNNRSDDIMVTEYAREPYYATLTGAYFDKDTTLVYDGYGRPDSGGWVKMRVGTHSSIIRVDPQAGIAVESH